MSIEVIVTVGGIFIVLLSGLVGIIYTNLKGDVRTLRASSKATDKAIIETVSKLSENLNDHKVEIVQRLTRIETLLVNGRKAS